MSATLCSATCLDAGAVVRLAWSDGFEARFHAIWLRDNAAEPDMRSADNGQRLVTIAAIDPGVRVATLSVAADDSVALRFTDGPQTRRFAGHWLRQHVYDRVAGRVPGWLADGIETWDGAATERLPAAGWDDIRRSRAALRDWLAGVARAGIGRITGGPLASGALLDVIALFGFVRETNYGRWFDVRSVPNPVNLAYTNAGLQAHTDNPYRDPVPTLQLLYCLADSAAGGESLVVDGFRAAHVLRDESPRHFELLARHCARFEYRSPANADLRARRPMIELSADGELIAIRFNNRSLAAPVDVPFDEMTAWYDGYRHFAEIVDRPSMAVAFSLAPGDSFLVDNTRVLHARRAFAGGGERWLQGCYADRDGLLSTLRMLEEGIHGQA